MTPCKHQNNDDGVVMMETLITLPLYLVLLFGLFVLGDYSLMRLKLMSNERVRHWENGLRHSSVAIQESDLFLNMGISVASSESSFQDTVRQSDPSSEGWSRKIAGAWRIRVSPSKWGGDGLESLNNNLWSFVAYRFNSESLKLDMLAKAKFTGGATEPIPTSTLSRMTNVGRNNTYEPRWFNIFSESYTDNAPIVVRNGTEVITDSVVVNAYGARSNAYVAWSD